MRLFKDNVFNYRCKKGWSQDDLAAALDVPISFVTNLESNPSPRLSQLVLFCARLDIDYSTVYACFGLKEKTVLDQYDSQPNDFKRDITARFYDELAAHVKIPDTLFHYTVVGRFKSGSASLTKNNMDRLQESVASEFSVNQFYELLASVMYSMIPNYNLFLIRKHFHLEYQRIGDFLGMSIASVSKWNRSGQYPIPHKHLAKLVTLFKGISYEVFTTRVLTDSDLKKCSIVEFKQPNESAHLDSFPELSDESIPEAAPDTHVKPTKANDDYPKLTNEQALKLYTVLDEEACAEVNELIAIKFFGA